LRRLADSIGRRLPKGWGDAGRQLGLFVLADLCYETVRGLAEGRAPAAFANAERIVEVERATGTFFEPGLQAAILDERWLVDAANWAYMNTHFVITTSFLVWLYLFRNEAFYFVRNMFLVAMALALVGYTVFPTAPPRLLPEEGFVDTIDAFAGVGHDSALVKLFVNPYAAVPSMHVAFALMIAVPGALICRSLATRVLWALYPLLVVLVIVVTGNHFWLDAAAGAAVAAVAALAARSILARVGPGAWSWRPAAGEAVA
jgi:membrane-associated phospholipid phosphatase